MSHKMAGLLLLVKISPKMTRKLALAEVPESVEHLENSLREKLQLQGSFTIQYEDPDFNNALCNLMDIHELPPERAVLHILWEESSEHPHKESDALVSGSSLDTPSTSTGGAFQNPSAFIRSYLRSVSEWPSPFTIPAFSYDVELKLRKGNDEYENTKKVVSITRDMKMDILDKIAQAVFEVKAYPDQDQIESVASALVTKHPCLQEPGSGSGYDGWKMSIKYKLGNYRSKLRQAGCNEVSINRKRKSNEDVDTNSSLKRAKRGEINYVPDYPDSHSDDSLEEERLALLEESQKRRMDPVLIKQKMELTFSLRRKEIVEVEPMVTEVMERWPALFNEAEIREEFHRITNKDLMDSFRAGLNQHTSRLLQLYRAKRTTFPAEMDQLLNRLDEETSDITMHRQTTALKGLPFYLRDSHEKLFRSCLDTDPEEEQTRGLSVGILTVLEDDGTSPAVNVMNLAVVVEETIILQDLPDLPTAFGFVFGLIYVLNLQYPKDLRYTFETVQKICMGLGTDLSARVRSLKNRLFL
uniref:Si:ch211-182e10.4 n=1 Tax=Nothobranchius furzeri TaxID=105023 RepID=A0A1A8A8R1_NOTFU